jgi:hypothetical protein
MHDAGDRGSRSDRDRLRELEDRVAALERRLGAAEPPPDDEPDATAPPRQLPDAVEGSEADLPSPGDAAPPAEGY